MTRYVMALLACLTSLSVCAQEPPTGTTVPPTGAKLPGGSNTFCLYEVPGNSETGARWINLTVMQYVELTDTKLHLDYGGGNYGSGHETDIPVKSKEEGLALLKEIQKTAHKCASGKK